MTAHSHINESGKNEENSFAIKGEVSEGLNKNRISNAIGNSYKPNAKMEMEVECNALSSRMRNSISMLELGEMKYIREFDEVFSGMRNGIENEEKVDDTNFEIGMIDLDDHDNDHQICLPKERYSAPVTKLKRSATALELRSIPRIYPIAEISMDSNVSEESRVKKPLKSAIKKKPLLAGSIENNSTNKTQSSGGMNRIVSFTKLHIREFPMTLGDNPSVRKGPPIGITWEHDQSYSIDLEDYEQYREPRRTKNQLIMSYYARKHMIERSGCSQNEINDMVSRVKRIKHQRQSTMKYQHLWKVQDAFESAKRKLQRIGRKATILADF